MHVRTVYQKGPHPIQIALSEKHLFFFDIALRLSKTNEVSFAEYSLFYLPLLQEGSFAKETYNFTLPYSKTRALVIGLFE